MKSPNYIPTRFGGVHTIITEVHFHDPNHCRCTLLSCAQSDALRISINTVAPLQLPTIVHIRMQEMAISVCVRGCVRANSLCYVLA
jgi:hypothetical protein